MFNANNTLDTANFSFGEGAFWLGEWNMGSSAEEAHKNLTEAGIDPESIPSIEELQGMIN